MKTISDFNEIGEYRLYLKAYFIAAALHSISDNDNLPATIAHDAAQIADAALKELGF